MKKPRLYRWHWLIALLLGVGTWWVVDWCISPKLLFKTTYSVQDAIHRAKALSTVKADADESNLMPGIGWHPRVWDINGHYLLIEEKLYDNVNFLDVIDLHTGRQIARHPGYPAELEFSSLRNVVNLADRDGQLFLIKTGNGYETGEKERPDLPFQLVRSLFNKELWKWNLLTNEAVRIRKYPMKCTRTICRDGNTLLETEQATPLLPHLLAPPSLMNILSGLAQAELGTNDLALMRVYSLPDLKRRCTVTLPWMVRQDYGQLSHDGKFLIIPDAAMMEGFTSPTTFRRELITGPGRPAVDVRNLYASHPLGIRIYETTGGTLWWQWKEVSLYRDFEITGDLVRFIPEIHTLGSELMLHLPSRTDYRSVLGERFAVLDQSRIHFFRIDIDSLNRSPIYQLDERGEYRQIAAINELTDLHQLIPGAPHTLSKGNARPRDIDRIADWFHERKWLMFWQPGKVFELRMTDYQTQRELWKKQFDHEPETLMVNNRMLISVRDREAYSLWIYALPFPSWSPWWPRGLGMVTTLLVWFAIARSARRRDVLP